MALCLSLCNRASRLVSCTYCMPLAVSYEVACWLADMSATCYIVVQVLIAHQATVSAVDHWSLTPLATAVISNQHAVAQLLREHGGALCSKMHRSFYPVHAATITGTPITSWHMPIHKHTRTHARTQAQLLLYLCSFAQWCTHLLLAHAHALSFVMCLSSVISLCAHYNRTQLQQSMSSSTTA